MEESAKAVFSSKIMQNNDEGWCIDAMVWFHVDDDADDDDDDDHDDDHDNDDIKDTFQSFDIQILQCHHIQNQTRFRLPGSFCFLWWGLPCRTHQLADFLLTTRFLSMSIVWA